MDKTIVKEVAVTKDVIARLAYQLWEKAGRPAGRDLEFWVEAEKQNLVLSKPTEIQPAKAALASSYTPPAPAKTPVTKNNPAPSNAKLTAVPHPVKPTKPPENPAKSLKTQRKSGFGKAPR